MFVDIFLYFNNNSYSQLKFHLLFFVLFGHISFGLAQSTKEDLLSLEIENSADIIKPNILSNHPLGMYISRINHNFKVRSSNKYSFSFDVSSGNVMLPYLKAYDLTNPMDRRLAESFPLKNRPQQFDLNSVPAETKEFTADGIIRSYKFAFSLPLSVNHEITFGIRSYSLDKGTYPF
ncbi:MAG: hypothetical protein ACI976_001182, partial [Aureispira sp.]